jgi:hypothetical protein
MSPWIKTAAFVVLAAFAGGILTLTTPDPAASAPGPTPAQVLVVNGAAQPVPVAPQGTTTVAGSVVASQGGTWNVGLTGTADVRVTNTAPVPVTVQGGEAAAPLVMNSAATSFTGLGEATLVLYTVPAGKRLLVEQIAFNTYAATGSVIAAVCRDGFTNCLAVPLQNQGVVAGGTRFVGSERVTYFADAGEQLLAACTKGAQSGGDYCSATFVGRLVDVNP